MTRWHDKADAFAEGWRRRFGVLPSLHAVVLGLAVAQHETWCGDAWPGEYNWGATTLRSLTAEERKLLADKGIVPTVGAGHKAAAAKAQAALVEAGLAPSNGVIHCDSTTDAKGQHPYFVYFFKGEDDADGAAYFVKLLAEGKPARAVLENPNGTEQNTAAAMYARGYFWGFKPHQKYMTAGPDGVMGTADDVSHDGNQENIDAYANALRALTPGIRAALKDWSPGMDPITASTEPAPPPAFDLSQPHEIQRALNALGFGRPLLKTEGNLATKSIAAIGFFQGANVKLGKENDPNATLEDHLAVTGVVDAETLAALKRNLMAYGLEVL